MNSTAATLDMWDKEGKGAAEEKAEVEHVKRVKKEKPVPEPPGWRWRRTEMWG